MKKKLISAILSIVLTLSFPISALADTIYGKDTWNVYFTADDKMESSFKSSEMTDSISGMQPGDCDPRQPKRNNHRLVYDQ